MYVYIERFIRKKTNKAYNLFKCIIIHYYISYLIYSVSEYVTVQGSHKLRTL